MSPLWGNNKITQAQIKEDLRLLITNYELVEVLIDKKFYTTQEICRNLYNKLKDKSVSMIRRAHRTLKYLKGKNLIRTVPVPYSKRDVLYGLTDYGYDLANAINQVIKKLM